MPPEPVRHPTRLPLGRRGPLQRIRVQTAVGAEQTQGARGADLQADRGVRGVIN